MTAASSTASPSSRDRPVILALVMPTTWPASLSSAPPELPGLSGVSVWIMPKGLPDSCSSRPRADTMPVDMEPSR